jgi:hypothetical protein
MPTELVNPLQVHLFNITANVLNTVMTVAVPVLVGMGVNYLRKRFKLNIAEQHEQAITGLAQKAVLTASQSFRNAAGTKEEINSGKKQSAVRMLLNDVADLGVKMTSEAAGNAIEAGVNRLKRERGAL